MLSVFDQRPILPATGGRRTGLFAGDKSGFGGPTTAGLDPPVLFITGALMWWNRVIRPRKTRWADQSSALKTRPQSWNPMSGARISLHPEGVCTIASARITQSSCRPPQACRTPCASSRHLATSIRLSHPSACACSGKAIALAGWRHGQGCRLKYDQRRRPEPLFQVT